MLIESKTGPLSGIKLIFAALMSITFYCYTNQDLKSELLKKIESGVPEWMNKRIAQDLAHSPRGGIAKEDIEETWENNSFWLALYRIKDGVVSLHTKPGMIEYASTHLCETMFNFLKELNSYIRLSRC